MLVLVTLTDAETLLRTEVPQLARNPVLIALVAGIGIGPVGVSVPASVGAGLDVLGGLVLPLALLCVGASLTVGATHVDYAATGLVTVTKVGCMPILAWVVFTGFGVTGPAFIAGVVMLATPTAVSTYVFAAKLGGDAEFASLNVFTTTVVSIATLLVVIGLMG